MRTVFVILMVAALLSGCKVDDKCEHQAMALATIEHPFDPNHRGPGSGHALPFIIGWMAGENCK